jgi:hypothetical protein
MSDDNFEKQFHDYLQRKIDSIHVKIDEYKQASSYHQKQWADNDDKLKHWQETLSLYVAIRDAVVNSLKKEQEKTE